MIKEVVIESLGGFVDEITPDEPDPKTGRHRESGVFRGSGCREWPLLTSLDRLGGADPPHTKVGLEAHLLRNFARYSRPYLDAAPINAWEMLVAAQHHGLPTRLLDWTYSPLVAAHFATAHPERRGDRAVWRLDWQRVHETFGFPKLAFLIQDLERLDGEEGGFTPWALFKRPAHARPLAFMLEPPSLDDRIVAQSAAFTVCTDTSKSFDAFLEERGLADTLTKYVIPDASVAFVRDQLDIAGVDEQRLFPDLDGVAARLRRYYS